MGRVLVKSIDVYVWIGKGLRTRQKGLIKRLYWILTKFLIALTGETRGKAFMGCNQKNIPTSETSLSPNERTEIIHRGF